MRRTRVSVIVPTFNRAGILKKAVNSILEQKYKNFEILIVDDGSTDDTEALVNSLNLRHPEVIYLKNFRAKGPSGARNSGILKAQGKYLAFLDSDDRWLKGHLRAGVLILDENSDIDVLFGNFKVMDMRKGAHLYDFFDQKEILKKLKGEKGPLGTTILQDNLFLALIQENFFHMGSAIIRNKIGMPLLFDESIKFGEDRDFAIRLYKERKAKFAYRQDPLFERNQHEASLMGSRNNEGSQEMLISSIYLCKKYLQNYKLDSVEKKAVKRLLSMRLLSLSYFHRQQAKYKKAMGAVLSSCRYGLFWRQGIEIIKILFSSIMRKWK